MTPYISLDKKAQRVQRKVLKALHVSISCFSFSHTFHSRLLKASSEQVSIIIAVSVAFGFYELRAVCAVFPDCTSAACGPLYTQNLRPPVLGRSIFYNPLSAAILLCHTASFSLFCMGFFSWRTVRQLKIDQQHTADYFWFRKCQL